MPTFSAQRDSFTPASWSQSSAPNWCLDAVGAGVFGKVIMIGWGGSLTTSTGYSTRWARPTSSGTGTKTTITLGYLQPNYTVAAFTAATSYATSQPVFPAQSVGDLWTQNWNGQGGVGVIVMPLANPWWVANGVLQSELGCQNYTGTDASGSSYSCEWEE